MPGIETRLTLLFSKGYVKGRVTLNHFVQLAAGNVARIYGLNHRKGSIAEGLDVDIAIWDPDETRIIRADELHDNMDYSPYEGMEVTGWPTTVIRRGDIIVADGELLAERASGEFIERRKSDFTGMPGRLAPELDPIKKLGTDLGL